MNLSVEQTGRGLDLVMLHGWGLHSGLWGSFADHLAKYFRLSLVDLPGHGYSRPVNKPFTLDSAVDAVATALEKVVKRPAIVLGWSLGALVATAYAAKFQDRVSHLIWVAGTPSFVARSDWPVGMAPATLEGFAEGLIMDYRATLRRFVSLNGGGGDRQLLRELQERLYERGAPEVQTLEQGLAILRDVDTRSVLTAVKQPLMLIQGNHDRLVHPDSVDAICALHTATVLFLERAGHAPFLVEPQRITDAIVEFVQ